MSDTSEMTPNMRLEHWFTYHPPTEAQKDSYKAIRMAALNLASVILQHTAPCADQSAAIRKVREAAMTANAAIACQGV